MLGSPAFTVDFAKYGINAIEPSTFSILQILTFRIRETEAQELAVHPDSDLTVGR
jgi:hypothetical protein